MRFLYLLLALTVATATSAEVVGIGGVGFISERNSTTNPLNAGQTFTGLADNVAGYAQINCVSFSDVASAVNGWSLELSTDGTNWDRKRTVSTLAGQSQEHTFPVVTEYFRVVYTNGSTNQSSFRLECIYNANQSKALTSFAAETINDSSDVLLMRGATDFHIDIARGLIAGHEVVRKFGRNPAVGATMEAIWTSGGDYTGFLGSASTISIVSTDADDTGTTGAGARAVEIHGRDATWAAVIEIVTMNGLTPVVTTSTWLRVNRIFVDSTGTDHSATAPSGAASDSNQGVITVTSVTGSRLMASMAVGVGQSEMAIYTVPLGKTAVLEYVEINVAVRTDRQANLIMWKRENDDPSGEIQGRRMLQTWDSIEDTHVSLYDSIVLPEKTDIWFSAEREDQTDAIVDIHFEMHVFNDGTL